MVRFSFGSATLWGGLFVILAANSASAQWFPFGGGNSCNCGTQMTAFSSAPIMRSASYSAAYNPVMQSAYAADSVQCGQPIACTIDQPVMATAQVRAIAPIVQTVKVEPLQQIHHPVMQTVNVTELQPVKQKVSRPVVETKMVDQTVTVMQPVTEQRTANVPTTDYQTVTEYRKVQKQAGYWATKTEATGKVSSCQYDNRPGFMGWMNRTGHEIRTAFQPQTRVTRTFVPQTMTCTVPCTKRVAVQGMKQVTYNVTSMVPQQQTRKVAVNTVRYVEEEVTALAPVTVQRTVQVGTHVRYAPFSNSATATGPTPAGSSGPTATGPANNNTPITISPTPDEKASAKKPANSRTATGTDDPDGFNLRGSNETRPKTDKFEATETVIPTRMAAKDSSVKRVNQWVAHVPTETTPQPGKPAMSLAGNAR